MITLTQFRNYSNNTYNKETNALVRFCMRCKQPLGKFEIEQFGNLCAGCAIDAIDFSNGDQLE